MNRYQRTISNPTEHQAYVLYNLLFSGDKSEFTAQDVAEWLGEYGIQMSVDEVRRELSTFVKTGLLFAYVGGYEVTGLHARRESA